MSETSLSLTQKKTLKTQVYTHDLMRVLALIPAGVKIVSFDCFDTLLWRKTAEPKDVFYSLCENETIKQWGLTVALRTMSEQVAYQLNKIKRNQTQATLTEIYQQAFPEASIEDINTLVNIEIACEKEACFAYEPMFPLIQALRDQGYRLMITSDTYFTKAMLTDLLSACMPPSILACFSDIYTSCDQGTAKFEHLFKKLLDAKIVNANQVCHIGDHPISDYEKPSQVGMHAIQLIQFQPAINEIIRMSSLAASFTDDSIRQTKPLNIHFKSELASCITNEDPAHLIGYAVIGPIMLAFGEYLIQSIHAIQKQGRPVKVAYLLRDAYLPARVTEKLNQQPLGQDIRISRFTAFAASFRSVDDIDTYLASRIQSKRFHEMGKQLGLAKDELDKLVSRCQQTKNPIEYFNQAIHKPAMVEKILKASKAYRDRLFLYLQKTMGVEKGDTLVFVDLGYTGTAQLRLAPVFKDEYDINIQGCYLLSLKTPVSFIKKEGLLSPEHYDDKTLVMLVTYIALLEQICTSTEASVTDFDENGNPIVSESTLDQDQIERIKPLHAACLQFIDDTMKTDQNRSTIRSAQDRRDIAATQLARLLYLPTKIENDYFSNFKHDVNMGTDDFIPLIDTNKSLKDLRQRGWLNSLKVQTKDARMNYPAEWRAISLELSVLLMAQHRFEFKVSATDLSQRSLTVPVILRADGQNSILELPANMTYDGYYALVIPTPSQSEIGIAFGAFCPSAHLMSADIIPMSYLYSAMETDQAEPAMEAIRLHDCQLTDEGVLVANSEEGLLLYKTPAFTSQQPVLRLIFKPLTLK